MAVFLVDDLIVFFGASSGRGVSLLVADGEKNRGRVLVPVPLLAWLFFLASADYLPVSSDFVVALSGLTKAGFALVVRVELDGDGGLVLIGGGLLACLAGLEKHGVVLSSGGASFLCPRCLYILYGHRVLVFTSFPIYGYENTISGLAVLAVLLAWCSCDVVGRFVGRSGVRLVGRRLFLLRRRGTVSLSLGHRLPLLAYSLHLVSVCDAVGAAVFSLRPSAGVVMLAVSLGWSGGGVFVPCCVLFVLACLAMVPYRPPPRFIRQDGRGDAADDPAA